MERTVLFCMTCTKETGHYISTHFEVTYNLLSTISSLLTLASLGISILAILSQVVCVTIVLKGNFNGWITSYCQEYETATCTALVSCIVNGIYRACTNFSNHERFVALFRIELSNVKFSTHENLNVY